MTKTKREKNSIIASFVFLVILNLIFILVLLLNIYPGIKDVEAIKEKGLETYNHFNDIKKYGQDLNEFKNSIKVNDNIEKNTYTEKAINELTTDFYNKYFKNKDYNSFEEFTDNLIKKYGSNGNVASNIQDVGVVLPTYSQVISNFDKNSISDFKFVNYVESLANSFNLSFEESIGINSVERVEGFSSSSSDSSLDSNIYYIPLNLTFRGRKESILNFIYFIENVGTVKTSDDIDGDDKLIFNNTISDPVFYDMRNFNIIGQTQKKGGESFYNILSDFGNISFPKYLDSSFKNRLESEDLVSYVKNSQGNDIITINATIHFYVKGLPLYIVEESINNFLKEHVNFLKQVTKVSKSKNSSLGEKERAEIILRSLNQIDTVHITSIKQSLSNKKDLDKSYNNVIRFREMYIGYAEELGIDFDFDSINKKLDQENEKQDNDN